MLVMGLWVARLIRDDRSPLVCLGFARSVNVHEHSLSCWMR
jgi:hypothetical protein